MPWPSIPLPAAHIHSHCARVLHEVLECAVASLSAVVAAQGDEALVVGADVWSPCRLSATPW